MSKVETKHIHRRSVLKAAAASTAAVALPAIPALAAADPVVALAAQYRRLRAAGSEAVELALEAERQIIETAATTLGGAIAKMRIAVQWGQEGAVDDRMLISALADAERLAGPCLPAVAG